jgi:hypothetical protein
MFIWHWFINDPLFRAPVPSHWDDIESLLYCLLFSLEGQLPWNNQSEDEVVKMKTKWLFEDSTKLPHPLCNFAFHCAEAAKEPQCLYTIA